MKKNLIFILLILVVAVSACTQVAPAASQQEMRKVSVNGTGKVYLTPDMATVRIGVQTRGDEADKAVSENNEIVQAVRDALSKYEIEDKDIQTSNFSVYPRTNYDDKGEITSISYVVNNQVSVTVRDLDDLGAVLNAVVDAGANNLHGIDFDVSDREEALNQAMVLAVENAQSRAETLAGAAGASLGEALTISTFTGGGGRIVYEQSVAADAMGGGNVPVSAGQLEVVVEVMMEFELK
jgi:uncharacterized protein YggE